MGRTEEERKGIGKRRGVLFPPLTLRKGLPTNRSENQRPWSDPRSENQRPRSANPLRPSLACWAGRRSAKKEPASRVPTNQRTLPRPHIKPRRRTLGKNESAKRRRASRARGNERFRARKSNRVKERLAKISLQRRGAHRALEATSAPPPKEGGRVKRELRY